MARPGAAARRSVMLADTGSHRLPVIRDEVAGTRRTLFLVFGLLVAMTGIAAFAIGGLITLRGEDEPDRLPAAPEQLAIMVGQLATSPSPAPAVPDPFEMLLQTPTNPPGVIAPPIIGLTEAPDGDSSPGPGSSGTVGPSGTPTVSSTTGCTLGASPSTPPAGAGGGSVPVLPLSTRCP